MSFIDSCTLQCVSITCSGSTELHFALPAQISPQTFSSIEFVENLLPDELQNATITFDRVAKLVVITNVDPLFESIEFLYSVTIACGGRKKQRVLQKVLVVPSDCSGGNGNQGGQGRTGKQGQMGKNGSQGRMGKQGFGNLGQQGRSGKQGAMGKDGKQGRIFQTRVIHI